LISSPQRLTLIRKHSKTREKIKKHVVQPVSLMPKMWYTSTVDGGVNSRFFAEAIEISLEKYRMYVSGGFLGSDRRKMMYAGFMGHQRNLALRWSGGFYRVSRRGISFGFMLVNCVVGWG
jgi:hypothetical protein